MATTIRPATASDKEACIELLQDFDDATGEGLSKAAGEVFERLLDRDRGVILLAEDDGELLGLASASFNLAMRYGGEYCQVEELVVDPAARGKHAGAELLEGIVAAARERGCAEIGAYVFEAAEHNRSFYEKFDFSVVGTEMRRPLG